MHSTSYISNTEFVHHRTEPHQYPGGSPSCWSRAWQSEWGRRAQAGAELNPGCKPLAPREGVRCPEDTRKGAPSPPARLLPRCSPCSPSHSNPLRSQGEAAGLEAALPSCSGPPGHVAWGAGRPWRESPPNKTSKCFTNKSRPIHRTCPSAGPWVEDMSGHQKASASTHKGEPKPRDHLPVPSKRTAAQNSSSSHDCLGKRVFSSLCPRACVGWEDKTFSLPVLLGRLPAEALPLPLCPPIGQPRAEAAAGSSPGLWIRS